MGHVTVSFFYNGNGIDFSEIVKLHCDVFQAGNGDVKVKDRLEKHASYYAFS